MGETVLVTGVNGFTGSYLAEELAIRGYNVLGMIRKTSKKSFIKDLNIKLVIGDLKNFDSLNEILKNNSVDIIYHVAALYRVEGVSKEEFFEVNAKGTERLLEAAIKNNVKRFVHTSTVGVQGEVKTIPATEEEPYNPGDHYQESKMMGEKIALNYFKNNKISGVVVRPVGIYGPKDLRFLKLFKHIYNNTFKMIGKGDVYYHMTFVKDLVNGIILAGEKKSINGEIFTLGGPEYVKVRELVEKIAKILDRKISNFRIPITPVYISAFICEVLCRLVKVEPPIYRRRLDFFLKDRAFDISKARKLLGYNPSVSLDEGLKITAKWYLDNGFLK